MTEGELYPVFRMYDIWLSMAETGKALNTVAEKAARKALHSFTRRLVAAPYQDEVVASISEKMVEDAVRKCSDMLLGLAAALDKMKPHLKPQPLRIPNNLLARGASSTGKDARTTVARTAIREHMERAFPIGSAALEDFMSHYVGTVRGSGLPNPLRSQNGALTAWVTATDDEAFIYSFVRAWTWNRAASKDFLDLKHKKIELEDRLVRTLEPRRRFGGGEISGEYQKDDLTTEELQDYVIHRFAERICRRGATMLARRGMKRLEAERRGRILRDSLLRYFARMEALNADERLVRTMLERTVGDFGRPLNLEGQNPQEVFPLLLAQGDERIERVEEVDPASVVFDNNYMVLNFLFAAWALARHLNYHVPHTAKPYVTAHALGGWYSNSIKNAQDLEATLSYERGGKRHGEKESDVKDALLSFCETWVILRLTERQEKSPIAYEELANDRLKEELPLRLPQAAFQTLGTKRHDGRPTWYEGVKEDFYRDVYLPTHGEGVD